MCARMDGVGRQEPSAATGAHRPLATAATTGSAELWPPPWSSDLAPGEKEEGGDERAGEGGEEEVGHEDAGTEGPVAWLVPSEGRATLEPRLFSARRRKGGGRQAPKGAGWSVVWGDLGLRTEGKAYIPAGVFGPAGEIGPAGEMCLWAKEAGPLGRWRGNGLCRAP
jgi:hypothetical protein